MSARFDVIMDAAAYRRMVLLCARFDRTPGQLLEGLLVLFDMGLAPVIPYGLVYAAKNTLTNRHYVGQTTRTLEERRAEHEASASVGSRAPFHQSLSNFGSASFRWRVLELCGSKEELDAAEARWIEDLSAHRLDEGYNAVKPGGTHG